MTFAFHISRDARQRYGVESDLFTLTGNAILPDFAAGRRLAQRMNEDPSRRGDPARTVRAGQLNAMGLLDEILHGVVAEYRSQVNPGAIPTALAFLTSRVGEDAVGRTLEAFAERFPTPDALERGLSPAEYLAGATDAIANREIALEELLMLWVANANPALAPFEELFDDAPLVAATPYNDVIAGLIAHFATQPPFGPDGQTLIEMLRAPAVAVPDSIAGQLRFVRERWLSILTRFGDRLLVTLDVVAEEEQAVWRQFHPAGTGDGAEDAARRASAAWLRESGWSGSGGDPEPEQFSVDRDWMPRLVLIAKSSFVWLDQLSKRYGRAINRLDEIPDEELDQLARWGFSGLWLIGLWQRSRASQTIKQLRGNPEAVASAYSLDDYRIADDLGGEEAFERLKARAWTRGLRIASDMVPNHMGVDSRWVVEHPDWFMALPEPPYPAYSFNGPDLSQDGRVGIQIEDHYFDNTDAAVVFKRWDRATGDTSFIYHGNDGTSMPWNDTAQLDYLKPEVREAVIQTILGVARRSPVIRFDAAMTLAKRHIERLWYPEPGHGGAIPSRAEHAMPKEAFEAAMPVEFWREVVDRVAAEVPDTLLLAEAFWLMEGYFVRTLGMHRVYNSAFMNMLRDEQNVQYRSVVKNTLEFDPEVLKRYVNFMNNPDEKTAVEQFGKGDKYFGIATLMATLPGLPMFGHGQVEGFTEKYGMEYRRAYWDEQPDRSLVERHEREIAPLLQRRHLFAEVEDFLFYDFVRDDGSIDEDVFAYSNRGGGEASLVVFHNRYKSTSGHLRESTQFMARAGEDRALTRRTIGDAFGLHDDGGRFTVLHDQRAGTETLLASRDLRSAGLRLDLDAYACRVFVGIREVQDAPGRPWARLAADLAGRAVPNVEDALRDVLLRPVLEPLRRVLEPERLHALAIGRADPADLEADIATFLAAACDLVESRPVDPAVAAASLATAVAQGLRTVARDGADAPDWEHAPHVPVASHAAVGETAGADGEHAPDRTGAPRARTGTATAADATPSTDPTDAPADRQPTDSRASAPSAADHPPLDESVLATWLLFRALPAALGTDGDGARARQWIDEWRVGGTLADVFRNAGAPEADAWRTVEAVKALLTLPAWDLSAPSGERVAAIAQAWLADESVARVLQVNVHRDVRWFNKEAFERFAALAAAIESIRSAPSVPSTDRQFAPMNAAAAIAATRAALVTAAAHAGYRVDGLLTAAGPAPINAPVQRSRAGAGIPQTD